MNYYLGYFIIGCVLVGGMIGLYMSSRYIILLVKRYGVPFITSKTDTMNAFIDNLRLETGDIFYDLGCGDGKIMIAVHNKFPKASIKGYEIDSKVYKIAKENTKKLEINIFNQNFMQVDLHDAKVIYCYLLPHLMPSLRHKINKECKSGTLLYSNAFAIKGISPYKEIILPSANSFKNKIYVYQK